MPEMNAFLAKLAESLRSELPSRGPDDLEESSCCDCRLADAATKPLPEMAPTKELEQLCAMVKEGCRGAIDLCDEDWRVILDEATYQIANTLRSNETIDLPNLGRLEIVYGNGGPCGRLTLAPEARP